MTRASGRFSSDFSGFTLRSDFVNKTVSVCLAHTLFCTAPKDQFVTNVPVGSEKRVQGTEPRGNRV